MYKIGETAEFDGVKRKVTGFSVINGVVYPNTEPYAESEKAPEGEGKDPNLVCQYCGKECGSPVGLISHERACKMNPANMKEGE